MPDFDAQSAITAAAQRYGVDPDFALSVAHAESGLNPNVRDSSAGAIGIMQLMPKTAGELRVDPRDPYQNIDGGVRYLRQLHDQFGGDPSLVAAAYNAGPHAVSAHGGIPPFPQTQAYVARVLGNYQPGAAPTQMPSPDEVMANQGAPSTPPAGGSQPPAAASASPSIPSPDEVTSDYGAMPPGVIHIVPDAHGRYHDQTGAAYSQDGSDPSLFTDPSGKQYRVTPSGPAPGGPATPVAPPSDAEEVLAGGVKGLTGLPDMLMSMFDPGRGFREGLETPDLAAKLAANPQFVAYARAHGYSDPLAFATQAVEDEFRRRGSLQPGLDNAVSALTGWNPESVPATTLKQRLEQAGGAGLSTAFLPGGSEVSGGRALASAGLNAARGALGGVSGELATEIAPKPLKPFAGVLGGAAGVGALEGGVIGVRSALEGVRSSPLTAALSGAEAERQAGGALSRGASDLPAVRSALSGYSELVPGARPTTAQATADAGLARLENTARARSPGAFDQVDTAQNAARTAAVQSIQSGGDPAAVSGLITSHLDQLDAETDAAVTAARDAAQAKAAGIGGSGTPESYGGELRTAITDAEDAARQREGALWSAVDPEGKLTGNMQATAQAAREIQAAIPKTAKPLSGEEADIFNTAAGLPSVAPVSDLIALRSRVSAEMRNELATNGRTPAYARLSQLRGAIQANLGQTISDAVQSDQAAVARGEMAPEDAFGQRFLASARQWQQGRAEGRLAAGDAVGSGNSPGRATSVSGVAGAATPTSRGSGNAPGNQGVSDLSGAPTFDAAASQRLTDATAATRERAATFGVRPVSQVTETDGARGQFKMPDGSVPGQFFRANGNGAPYDLMQRALKAGGDAGRGILEDYAALTLRREATNADGVIDPRKFAAWQRKYSDALRALPPELQRRFADAASAGQALSDAAAARAQALNAYRKSAVGKLIGVDDPAQATTTIGNMLSRPDDFRALVDQVKAAKGNPAAMGGLRQAVVDNMMSATTRTDAAGASTLDGAKFRQFVSDNRSQLAQVFRPDEMARLDNIAADLDRANATRLAGKTQPSKPPPQGQRVALDLLGELLGQGLGHAVHHLTGAPFSDVAGGAVGIVASEAMQALRNVGVNRVQDLIAQALINPDVARRLLAKAPTTAAQARLDVRGLVAAVARGAAVGVVANNTQQRPILRLSAFGTPVTASPVRRAFGNLPAPQSGAFAAQGAL